ncbi:MAG: Plug domain-containing protein [Nitrospira sp.]|nr:Plug domain-containing protein [Nitrospira sp.]
MTPAEQPIHQVCETSSHDRSYAATCATSASLQPETPIKDIPSSVQGITRPVIDDQKAMRVGDALRNVSGVQGGGR